MPTVSVDKAELWERLGQEFCKSPKRAMFTGYWRNLASEDFDKLCFEYGLELDEDVRLHFNKNSN